MIWYHKMLLVLGSSGGCTHLVKTFDLFPSAWCVSIGRLFTTKL